MITDWFHGVKISKSYDYQAFLQPVSPRVNCNREYARATDPCGSFQIRDTPLTRDWNRVMDFHVAVTGMKIAYMARLELFFYMIMPRLIIVVLYSKVPLVHCFCDNLLQKNFCYLENSFLLFFYLSGAEYF